MFTRKDEVATFINYLEDFVKAVYIHHIADEPDSAAFLNRKRSALEEYIIDTLGITDLAKAEADSFECPECGSKMLLRTNRQNGDRFWGCSKYPNCRGTRDSAGLSKAERAEESERNKSRFNSSQEAGFSFNRSKRSPSTEVGPDQSER